MESAVSSDEVTHHHVIGPTTQRNRTLTENVQMEKRVHEGGRNGGCESEKQLLHAHSCVVASRCSVEQEMISAPLVKCSNMETLMNMIKGTVGTGILSLPLAFKHSGLWVGLILFLAISAVAVHCMHVTIRCTEILEKRTGTAIQKYPDMIEKCIFYGPFRFRRFAPFIRTFVTGLIIVIQCGFCCIYIIWVAVNTKWVVDQYWIYSPDVRLFETVITLFLVPYLMVGNLRILAMFSALANIIYFLGLVVIYQYMLQNLPDSRARPAFNSWSQLPMFFGTAIFSFENMCLIVPLRSKMRQQEDFGGWSGVLNLGMVITTAVYAATGFYGFLKFGDDVAATVTLNLPRDQWLYQSVNLIFAFAMFMTVGVQFYVLINIVWPAIEQRLPSDLSAFHKKCAEFITRTSLLCFIFAVPHVDLLMSLAGSFCGSLLAVVLPALVELLTLYEERELTAVTAAKDTFIVVIGIIGFASGSYTSMIDIVKSF